MAEILNHYQGKATPETIELPDGTAIPPYLPDPGLVEAVNLSVELRRPLLIMGEPGCGKTKLAQAVAYELNKANLHKEKIKWKDVYFEWHVKSLSKAREGLYRFDYIERLQDAQLDKTGGGEMARLRPEPAYVKRGPLGLAFEATHKTDGKVVVLIDEIDKADPDFPNCPIHCPPSTIHRPPSTIYRPSITFFSIALALSPTPPSGSILMALL